LVKPVSREVVDLEFRVQVSGPGYFPNPFAGWLRGFGLCLGRGTPLPPLLPSFNRQDTSLRRKRSRCNS
jgi:hypothetical protein